MKAMSGLTARLRIEPLRVGHAAMMFPVLADPRLYEYAPDTSRASVAELISRFAQLAAGPPADAGEVWLNWVLITHDNGVPVGTLQATLMADGRAWVGYSLVPAAWGQGLASEACAWLLAELPRRHGVREILASVDVRNAKSIALLERSGFECFGTEAAELNGEPTTDHLYRIACAP